jgi:hypothetical protein
MPERIPYPIKGLDQNWGFADQPPLTTVREVNMVGIDPTNGRTRGSQRAGSNKWCPDQISGTNPVRELIEVKSPADRITFSELDPLEVGWAFKAESQLEVLAVRGDDLENTYWLERPNRIVKRNPKGVSVWTLSIPTTKAKQVCRALEVDPFGTVYVAVTEAVDPGDGAIWAFQVQPDETQPTILYRHDVRGVIEHLVWKDGRLYAGLNDFERYQSQLLIIDAPDTTAPFQANSWPVPYPCNAIAVKDDGSVFTSSPAFADRLLNPSYGDGTGQSVVNWTPRDLENYEKRLWGWWDSTDIFGNESQNVTLADNERVTYWYSKVGSRFLTSEYNAATRGVGAVLEKERLNGKDAVFFAGGDMDADANGPGMQGVFAGNKNGPPDSQTGSVPASPDSGYTDELATFALFVLFRPAKSSAKMGLLQGKYFPQATDHEWGIFLNTPHYTGGVYPELATLSEGSLCLWDAKNLAAAEGGAGTNGQPLEGAWDESASGICLLTYMFDAGMDLSASVTSGFRSCLRLNGQPIDRWGNQSGEAVTAQEVWPPAGFWLGLDAYKVGTGGAPTTWMERFEGHVLEIIVLRTNSESSGKQSPATVPAYPDVSHIAGSDTEVERIEGYLMWKWGLGAELENNNGKGGITPAGYIHPYGPGDLNAPPSPGGRSASGVAADPETFSRLNGPHAVLAKWTNGGSLAWVYSEDSHGGVGSGLALHSDGGVFSVGPPSTGAGALQYTAIRRFHDYGTQYGEFGFDVTFPGGTFVIPARHVDIQSDPWDNVWIPFDDPLFSATSPWVVGSVWALTESLNTNDGYKYLSVGGGLPGVGLWIPPILYEYGDEGLEWPEKIYLACKKEQTAVLEHPGNAIPAGFGPSIEGVPYLAVAAGTSPVNPGEWETSSPVDASQDMDRIYAAINADRSFFDGRVAATTTAHPLVEAIQRGQDLGGDEILTIKALNPGAMDLSLSVGGSAFTWTPTVLPQSTDDLVEVQIVVVEADVDSPAPPRTVKRLGVANGFVKVIDGTGAVAPAGAGSIDQSSTGALKANGIPFGTNLFGKTYLVDGVNLLRYDPKTDTLVDFEPSDVGAPPSRIILLETWRQRLVAISSDDRWNYYMSKVGDPDNWDYFPPILGADQATFGDHPNNTAGRVPDIITGFVPVSDDIALWGCDSSLWRLTGDPMRGGQNDHVSTSIGMAFGRAWAIAPDGIVYFFGSRGGVFRVNPQTGALDRITRYRIERATQDLDQSVYRIRLCWDYERDGLMVSAVPYGAGGSLAKHWFWDEKNDRWSEFEFGNSATTTVQPTALHVIDGDEVADRVLLLGCEDGYVRYMDSDAADDDGVAIDSRVLIGPLASSDLAVDARFSAVRVVLGAQHDGATLEMYAAEDWEDSSVARVRLPLQPGRNEPTMDSVRGPACWVGLRNPWPGQRWSFEAMYLEAEIASEALKQA